MRRLYAREIEKFNNPMFEDQRKFKVKIHSGRETSGKGKGGVIAKSKGTPLTLKQNRPNGSTRKKWTI